MFERFTDDARKSLAHANQEAQRLEQTYIGPEHILLGIAAVQKSCGASVLAHFNLDLDRLRSLVEDLLPNHQPSSETNQAPQAKNLIMAAIAEARNRDDTSVTTGHILLALLADENGVLRKILANSGVDPANVSEQILLTNKQEIDKPQNASENIQFSSLYKLWRILSPAKRTEPSNCSPHSQNKTKSPPSVTPSIFHILYHAKTIPTATISSWLRVSVASTTHPARTRR